MTIQYAPAALPAELDRWYRSFGFQTDVTIPALMQRNATELGALPAVFDGEVQLTWGELMDRASRFGGFLHAHGIGRGDVVTWQLPNWWECLVAAYGAWAAGAVSNPIVPIYRNHEMRQVIAAVQPAAIVTAATFRGCDHAEMITGACAEVGWEPTVKVVIRGTATGWVPFDDALRGRPFYATDADADDPSLLGFTSGTTSGAKGVVHSARGFLSSPLRQVRMAAHGWHDRSYMAATLAHATGVLSAIASPLYSGSSTVIRDRWDPELAVRDITDFGVTTSAGASVFIQGLLEVLESRGIDRLPLSSGYPCGGSTIPSALARRAEDAGIAPRRAYGMTECPGVTGSSPFDAVDIRCDTDGLVAPGCEVRVVDLGTGAPTQTGASGELLVRGPQRALGYLSAAHTAEGFDAEGWFRTGDLGILDARNALTVTGRVKEIINRGGEKISSREIEEVLVRNPAIADVAVVAAPHDRLGEQPAAFVSLRRGASTTAEELTGFLAASGLAAQKIPRVWRWVDELPRTASGKVKKFVLQAELGGPGMTAPPRAAEPVDIATEVV